MIQGITEVIAKLYPKPIVGRANRKERDKNQPVNEGMTETMKRIVSML